MKAFMIALLHYVSQHLTLCAHQAHKSFLKPSQLPGEYAAQLLPLQRIGLIKHNNQLCPRRYPFTPGWREAIMVKCLAQGHMHHKSNALNRSTMALQWRTWPP